MRPERSYGPATNAVAREVALAGDQAVASLGALDWSVTPHSARFQIFADLIRSDSFAIGRIWHTPASMTFLRRHEYSDGLVHSVLGIEGTHTIVSGADQVALHPGQLHLRPLKEPMAIIAQQPVARLFFVARWEDLHNPDVPMQLPRRGNFGGQSAFRDVFANAAHAALNSVTTVDGSGFVSARAGLQHLFASMLADDAPDRSEPGAHSGQNGVARDTQSSSLLRRASKEIERLAGDVSFGVTKLARTLGVSSASLYRSYQEANTTPASQLREVRARRARMLLNASTGGVTGTQNLKRVAEQAGFGSVRAMQRALLEVVDPSGSAAEMSTADSLRQAT